MKPLFDLNTLNEHKGTKQLFPMECEWCHNIFRKNANDIRKFINGHRSIKVKFCSRQCGFDSRNKKISVNCQNCNVLFIKRLDQVLKSKNNFCSSSCAATYNNKHKVYGIRRSKLEMYVENNIKNDFPNIDFLVNDKTTISSELDFLFPNMKFAIELNGITHYKPIYGQRKFEMIVKNDNEKKQLCVDSNITLYTINTSSLSYNVERNFIPYYEYIKEIIKKEIIINGINITIP